MDRRAMRHLAEYLVFRVLVCGVDLLTPRAATRWAQRLAWVFHFVLPRKLTRYAVARDNLRIAFGEGLDDAAADGMIFTMWQHLFRLVVEMVQSPRRLHLFSYRQIIEFVDHRKTVEAVLSGRRVLVLGGHFGNWEVATSIFGLWGFPMGIVAREMDNPYLHRWFARTREDVGHRLLMKKGDFDGITALLGQGGNLGLLCDQDAGPRGLFVDFFGTPASTFKSLALLAMEYDALLMVGCAYRLPDQPHATHSRIGVLCEDLIDPREMTGNDPVRSMTERFTSALERVVLRAPEQYFWLHRRWKSQPRVRAKAA